MRPRPSRLTPRDAEDSFTSILSPHRCARRERRDAGRLRAASAASHPLKFGRVVQPTVAVPGDCVSAMRMLLSIVDYQDRAEWHARCADLKKTYPFAYTPPADGRIKTQTVSCSPAVRHAATKLHRCPPACPLL
eukprot:scaffold181237_cov26-Tisochrysis_lutea.AAC.3